MVMTTKEKKYELLVKQVASLIEGEHDAMSVMANTSAALREAFESYFWVGFYVVKNDELLLGPFQGTVACFHIKKGKGVCGAAWHRKETVIVADVEQFAGHIACSSQSRSEIVVPVFDAQGQVWAVLDIDSTNLSTFDKTDQLYLEQIATLLTKQLFQ